MNTIPEGTQGTAKDGTPVVRQGGRWVARGGMRQTKPIPAAIQKMQSDELEALSAASGIAGRIGGRVSQIDSGELQFGPVKNIVNQGRNLIGASTPASRNYSSFRNDLEKMRNDSLRLNSGVQTEGDAQRAWNELVSNLNDDELVRQRLLEIDEINSEAARLREERVKRIRQDSMLPPISLDPYRYQGASAQKAQRAQERGKSTLSAGRADLERAWANKYGSVRASDPSGMTFGEFLMRYQSGALDAPARARRQRDKAAQSGNLPVGTVRNGYRYTGGNPADRKNWKAVK